MELHICPLRVPAKHPDVAKERIKALKVLVAKRKNLLSQTRREIQKAGLKFERLHREATQAGTTVHILRNILATALSGY